MTPTLADADSLLVVDVGSVNTRALLFDVVDGRYRFLAAARTSTTAGAPYHDVSEGVRRAIGKLQETTGRPLVGSNERLILPSTPDGAGIDAFAATISVGPPLKVVLVGLLDDVSLESARHLAATTYTGPVETISLSDRRKPEARLDAILRFKPDLIVVAGGTEGGASQSVFKLLEPVRLACQLTPENSRPAVLFTGNGALQPEMQATLEKLVDLNITPNIRPSLETEQLNAAQTRVAKLTANTRGRQIAGVRELNSWAGGGLLPTAAALGRVIRFFSKAHTSSKGILGVDIGASATTLAAANNGELSLGVYPQFGLGAPMGKLLEHIPLKAISAWLAVDVPEEYLRTYLANKALYPANLPATPEDLAIEQAVARAILRQALKLSQGAFTGGIGASRPGLLPWFEPIMASGSVLTRAPSLGQAALMLLDGLQPVGATTLMLDPNQVLPALGVAAAVNPVLVIQTLDTNALVHLGTVISPLTSSRPGTPILKVKIHYEPGGQETTLDVKQGGLEILPLPPGQEARLQLTPLHRADLGMGMAGRMSLHVHGGALGVIIDARGRPLRLPEDPARRAELYKKWLWTLRS